MAVQISVPKILFLNEEMVIKNAKK